jgi:hypothetical protein
MSGTAPSGTTWSAVLRETMAEWTDKTDFTFIADTTYVDPCTGLSSSGSGSGFPAGAGDNRNSADFRTTVCGNSFGSGVLAITLSLSNQGSLGFQELTQTDILFNANHQWDVYDGTPQSRIDFRRVALHELGHAMGLNHESSSSAIMAPNYGSVNRLQADDIAGANAMYGSTGSCLVRDLVPSVTLADGLAAGDCRVRDLFTGSNDDSFVDVYKLTLARATDVDIQMHSDEFDTVLVLTDATFGGIEIHDDFQGQCDAHIRKRLPAGEYRILANTYETPVKCGGNTGGYRLTISDSGMPLLGEIRNAVGGSLLANAVITGGATADAGATFATTFAATQAFDVFGNIVPDPLHVGRQARLFVVAVLGDGRFFMQNGNGDFVPFGGDFGTLVPRRTGILGSQEFVPVVSALKGSTSGLSGQTVSVYIGYALDSAPLQIWYGGAPIHLTIGP